MNIELIGFSEPVGMPEAVREWVRWAFQGGEQTAGALRIHLGVFARRPAQHELLEISTLERLASMMINQLPTAEERAEAAGFFGEMCEALGQRMLEEYNIARSAVRILIPMILAGLGTRSSPYSNVSFDFDGVTRT